MNKKPSLLQASLSGDAYKSILFAIFAAMAFLSVERVSAKSVSCRALFSQSLLTSQETKKELGAVQAFLNSYLPYLRSELAVDVKRYPEGLESVVLSNDLLACRMCGVASSILYADLKRKFRNGGWTLRMTSEAYQKFLHIYIFSERYQLMVDPTYRQFIVEDFPQAASSLPAIFVGSPQEFAALMTPYMPASVIDNYLHRFTILPKASYRHRRSQKFVR